MIDTQLRLPDLELKPRRRGLTMVIDPGLFTGQFEDAIDSVGEFVDFVKFGWGTCLVTKDIKRKIDILRRHRFLLRRHAVRALRSGRSRIGVAGAVPSARRHARRNIQRHDPYRQH